MVTTTRCSKYSMIAPRAAGYGGPIIRGSSDAASLPHCIAILDRNETHWRRLLLTTAK